MGHVLGAEKEFFLIRGDDAPWSMAGAPVESCQSLPKRSPWGRLGSVLYTCTRLRRIRRRFKDFWPISLSRPLALAIFRPGFASRALREHWLLHRWRKRRRRLPTTRLTSRGLQEPIWPRKKCAIWTRWRPVPGKNVNYPRAPRNRNSGLVGPHTTPPIVNYKYMASTPREGYFGPTTLGT